VCVRGGGFVYYFFNLGLDDLAAVCGDLGGLTGVDVGGGWQVGDGGIVIQVEMGVGADFILGDARGE